MKTGKIICAVAILLFLMVFVTGVHAQEQEIINENEFETRFAEDSEALLASLEANTTVVVPAPGDHECMFAILWKKIKVLYENGTPVIGASVTLDSDYAGTKVWIGWHWVDPPATKTTDIWGSVSFLIYWDSHPPPSINVTLTISKDSYSYTEVVTLYGHLRYYCCNCICNKIRIPPPGAPEFELATPVITSVGAAAYLWFRRRREKQSI